MLGEEQAGFRSTYSTIDYVFVLKSIIDFYYRKGNTYIVLLLITKEHLS